MRQLPLALILAVSCMLTPVAKGDDDPLIKTISSETTVLPKSALVPISATADALAKLDEKKFTTSEFKTTPEGTQVQLNLTPVSGAKPADKAKLSTYQKIEATWTGQMDGEKAKSKVSIIVTSADQVTFVIETKFEGKKARSVTTTLEMLDKNLHDVKIDEGGPKIQHWLRVGGKLVRQPDIDKAVEPVQSDHVRIYTNLAAGFAYSGAKRFDWYATQLLDGAGNPVVRDGHQVYQVRRTAKSDTVSAQLTGQVSVAFDLGPKFQASNSLHLNAWGITFGSGIANSTSGNFSLAPFAGLSLFFGNNDSFVLTGGVSWVPTKFIRGGFGHGSEILTDQISTYDAYGPPDIFIGLSYRIGGEGGKKKENEKPKDDGGS